MRFYQPTKAVLLLIGVLLMFSSCKEQNGTNTSPPDVSVVNVIQKDVPIYKEFVGQVYGLLDIPIRARVEGFLETLQFNEGRKVKKGQVLYTIDSQPFLAEVAAQKSKVAEAKTYLVNAQNELARYQPLAEINAVSKSDLDAATATRDAAIASLDAANANLKIANINLGYCTIKSPINGLIGRTEARVGEFVGKEPNPVILNMVSEIEKARVQFFITESEYLTLVKGIQLENPGEDPSNAKARQSDNIELLLADGTVYKHKGNFDFIDRDVDVSTGSIMVQTLFQNPEALLRPGMFAKVKVKFETVKDAILVPQKCVIELQGKYSVFIVNSDGTVKSQQVTAGAKIGDLWLITDGLKSSDQVVLEGLQKVRSDMKINPIVTEFKSQSNQ